MRLSKAIEGFALYCAAEKKMPLDSVEGYTCCLERFTIYTTIQGKECINEITIEDIVNFFVWLETDYKPRGWNSKNIPKLSSATVHKTWTAMRSFYKWASSIYGVPGTENIMAKYPAPKMTQEDVLPFTESEVKAILSSVKPTKCKVNNSSPNVLVRYRNYAMVQILLDVGLRNSELRNLRVGDWLWASGRLHVRRGKGGKDRYVFLGQKTRYAVWQYTSLRPDASPDDWLFPLRNGGQISKTRLQVIISRIGKKAGVSPCYPHRFRHTCAVMRVLNGQGAETLMHVLGHTTINMSMRYVNLARVDTSQLQRTASPVDNL